MAPPLLNPARLSARTTFRALNEGNFAIDQAGIDTGTTTLP